MLPVCLSVSLLASLAVCLSWGDYPEAQKMGANLVRSLRSKLPRKKIELQYQDVCTRIDSFLTWVVELSLLSQAPRSFKRPFL